MERYICIHGHFYQPPRENPWLDEVELQDSAYPYHDWNERVTEECYAPNTASRILDGQGRIVDIANLYSKISFNFGPTLLSWLERHKPDVYRAIIEADAMSMERYGGHGSAIAQVYNHMIMPLATRRDKVTQVLWGISDFRRRFRREPEGMWLPETAVDLESLDVLAEAGIRYTILAPRQAAKVRSLSASSWEDVSGERVDPNRPYLCILPTGRRIALFFYDGPISRDVAFGGLLSNGGEFADRLLGAFPSEGNGPAMIHIATDGESYGHHHRGGDMALAFCLHQIEEGEETALTNYGEFLERHPPRHEVEIFENSSWSCVHGVERWRGDCGCHTGTHPEWSQRWRSSLREGMDWLGKELTDFFGKEAPACLADPWRARDAYVDILNMNGRDHIEEFLRKYGISDLSKRNKTRSLKLLELQRNAQLIFSSCGWFFDDVAGIETVQILRYAARAIQFVEELGGPSLENQFRQFLENAPGNRIGNGAKVFDDFVRPARLDTLRIGAHYCISSLFENYPEKIQIYSYSCSSEDYERVEAGRVKLATGRVRVASDLTWDEETLSFAVLHMGDQNLSCGVGRQVDPGPFAEMRDELTSALEKGDVTDLVKLIDRHFRPHTYSLWHLFKDEQRKVLDQVLRVTYEGIETSYRRIHENNYALMNFLTNMEIPLPRPFIVAAEYVADQDLRSIIAGDPFDGEKLARTINDVARWSLSVDRKMAGYHASSRITALMEQFRVNPDDLSPVEAVKAIIRQLLEIGVELDLWKAQNAYFSVARETFPNVRTRAERGDAGASRWVDTFLSLGPRLQVRVA